MTISRVLLGAAVTLLALPVFGQPAGRPEGPLRTYLLGPDDVITVHVVDAEEFPDKPIRIGPKGLPECNSYKGEKRWWKYSRWPAALVRMPDRASRSRGRKSGARFPCLM